MLKKLESKIKIFSLILLFTTSITSTFLCRDPDQFKKFLPEYQVNVHKVTTDDGYHLHMFQVLPNKSNPSIKQLLTKDIGTESKGTNLIFSRLGDSRDLGLRR